jgi:putative FmdB family regulatory protein
MPLYDFHCRRCDHQFEALVRSGDAPRCPECGAADLERLLSTFALSTDERRHAAALDSRKRQIRANRDKVIADEEYRQKHDKE